MAEDKANERIEELEAELADLKEVLEGYKEEAEDAVETKIEKVRSVLEAKADDLMASVKPVLDKYEESGKAAVGKVGDKVADNPFMSVVVAFGAGIVIGKLLDMCCKENRE